MAETVYSRNQIDDWQQKLEKIAQQPRTTFTKKQAVEELIDTIEKALKTRSYAEVAAGLKEWGLDISEGALKQYVSRYRRDHKKGPAKRRGRKAMREKPDAVETSAEVTEVKQAAQREQEPIQEELASPSTSAWDEDEFNL